MSVLDRWVLWVSRHHRWVLIAIGLITCLALYLASSLFRINSDLSQLIDQTSDWRMDFDHFEREFPDLVHTAIVVVDGESAREVRITGERVLEALLKRQDSFTAVAAPGLDPFFRQHALLYLSDEDFDQLVSQLSSAQPILSAIQNEPHAGSLLDRYTEAIRLGAEGAEFLGERILLAAQRALRSEVREVDWLASEARQYQLIFLKPRPSFTEAAPDAQMMRVLRQLLMTIDRPADVNIRVTGEIALQHEEIEAAIEGVSVAGWLALGLLFLVMLAGVRSAKIIVATFALLFIGLIWTAAYAMLGVGSFNTLSIVFVVLFFGLAIDFALHYSLRLQQAVAEGENDIRRALALTSASVGRAISLCTLTTAIGFLCFVPTAYRGLAELGIICAGGMVIAWVLTFTFLPAFFTAVGLPKPLSLQLPSSLAVTQWLMRRRSLVIAATLLVTVVAALVSTSARFDYSVLALKNPQSPSMLALRELQANQISTDYQLVVLTPDAIDVGGLERLPSVASVGGAHRLIPEGQDARMAQIEELSFLLWGLNPVEPPDDVPLERLRQGLAQVREALEMQADVGFSVLSSTLAELETASDGTLRIWNTVLTTSLMEDLNWLYGALNVETFTLEQVPPGLLGRFISASGDRLYTVLPANNIAPVEGLEAFIGEVTSIYPNATGRPVLERGVGGIVINAFQQAMLFAMVGIGGVLLLVLRHWLAALLTLSPLLLAGVLTMAVGVLIDQPVNMASVLVLPLIFGLGVDNGIHIVDRYLHGQGLAVDRNRVVDRLMQSSTPRAVLLSSLTTIGAFSALSISPHQGTASIGLLLTISLSLLLLLTIFLLPVLLSFLPRR